MVLLEMIYSIPVWTVILTLIIIFLHIYIKQRYSFFKRKGIVYKKPFPLVGTMGRFLLRRETLDDYFKRMYHEFRDYSYYGVFEFLNPILTVKDPEIIKQITIKDFESFASHRNIVPTNDPILGNFLFVIKGKKWREIRNILTPVFTANKMKSMFTLMLECGQQLNSHVEKLWQEKQRNNIKGPLQMELRDLMRKFSNDVIATTAFGITCDSLSNPNNEFYEMGIATTTANAYRTILFFLYASIPRIMSALRIKILPQKLGTFFNKIVRETIAIRKKTGLVRPDLINILMQVREEEDVGNKEGEPKSKILTDDQITAQAAKFFLGGFDGTASLQCILLHQITIYPEIQKRLQAEIDTALQEHGGKLTYDILQGMKYLDMVLSECLRKYPQTPFMDRQATKAYFIESDGKNPGIQIEKGDQIMIPVSAIQNDPKYYPDPDKFDPERFSDENKSKLVPYTYMPFGIGPRMCIGNRFAMMEAKVCVVALLSDFNLVKVQRTPPEKIPFAKHQFMLTIHDNWWTGFEKRDKKAL